MGFSMLQQVIFLTWFWCVNVLWCVFSDTVRNPTTASDTVVCYLYISVDPTWLVTAVEQTLCGARGRCRISPPHFLAECRRRRLNQGSFVSAVCLVVCFLWFLLCLCVYFFCDYIELCLIVCLSVTVKWLAVKTASKMIYTVSGGALNFTQSNVAVAL